MSYDWGPHYIVPTSVLKSYSGAVVLREQLDEELLNKEMESIQKELRRLRRQLRQDGL